MPTFNAAMTALRQLYNLLFGTPRSSHMLDHNPIYAEPLKVVELLLRSDEVQPMDVSRAQEAIQRAIGIMPVDVIVGWYEQFEPTDTRGREQSFQWVLVCEKAREVLRLACPGVAQLTKKGKKEELGRSKR